MTNELNIKFNSGAGRIECESCGSPLRINAKSCRTLIYIKVSCRNAECPRYIEKVISINDFLEMEDYFEKFMNRDVK